ncbi:hypothetical protein J7E78_14945 [Paenibacillus polymyxa]|uniref:hypothetical protein n=1 Tax=Paenibacillus polymyxa TaxID=1406 RepID=UPI001BE76CF4|nr:hypothetical protein [Paenibacillus polymyxa]MBT2284839.1 hypothetical protein [Paenibacillus polymyxa]
MIKAKVLLNKPVSLIEEETGIDNWLVAVTQRPEARYADVNDRKQLERLMMGPKFGLDCLQMAIHVIDECGQSLIGYEVPSGLNIWQDYLRAIRKLMEQDKACVSYGIDPYLLELERQRNGQLRCTIRLELFPQDVLTQFITSEKLFLSELLRAIEFLWSKLLREYPSQSEFDICKPKNEGKDIFIEIESLRKWLLQLPK